MEPKISQSYLFFRTTKEVWDGARRMYSDLGNASLIFELRLKLIAKKHGSNAVSQYLYDLQDIWQELDLFFLWWFIMCSVVANNGVNLRMNKSKIFWWSKSRWRGQEVAWDPFRQRRKHWLRYGVRREWYTKLQISRDFAIKTICFTPKSSTQTVLISKYPYTIVSWTEFQRPLSVPDGPSKLFDECGNALA